MKSQEDATAKYGEGTQYGKVGHIYSSVYGLVELGDNSTWHYFAAKDEYEVAILAGKITYTQHYGWVDMSHAFYGDGALNLIQSVKSEKGFNTYNGGFFVQYSQTARVFRDMPRVGVSNYYTVKYGLSNGQALSVAMGIFQEVSIEFEHLQRLASWSGSSFEPADLPSNLLGFYASAGIGLSKDRIMNLIQPVDKATSLMIYRMYPGTFTSDKYKNHTFSPIYFPNPYTTECPEIPLILQSIQSEKKGVLYKGYQREIAGPTRTRF